MDFPQPYLQIEHSDRILAQLGQGGMAEVKLAIRFGPGGFRKLYVIKRLRRDIANESYAQMFLHEARLAALLSHPNVVQSHEVNQNIDDCYLKMEYLEGQTLARLVRRVNREQLPLEIHLYVLTELLAGLHHAHELTDLRGNPLNVVHRDVSPGNLFLTYDGQVKLLDFGIAHSVEAPEPVGSAPNSSIKGKIAYMSPEQARCIEVDRRSDLYSVGIMLWEAIACGPFVAKGESTEDAMQRRKRGEFRPIEDRVPTVAPALAAICNRAMAFDPKDRFSDAHEMREALLEQIAQMSIRPTREGVSAVISSMFHEERDRLDAVIAEKIVSEGDPREILFTQTLPGVPGIVAANTGSVHEPEAPPSSRGRWSAGLVALLAVSAVVGVLLLNRNLSERADLPDVPPTATDLRVPVAPSASTVKPATAQAPSRVQPVADTQQVQLMINAEPAQASIKLDGALLGTGSVQHDLDRDAKTHNVLVEMPGYKSIRRSVVVDRDTRLEISLVPNIVPTPSREPVQVTELKPPSQPLRTRTSRQRPTRAATRKRSSSARKAPARTKPAQFGDDLSGKRGIRQREIDKENPYQ